MGNLMLQSVQAENGKNLKAESIGINPSGFQIMLALTGEFEKQGFSVDRGDCFSANSGEMPSRFQICGSFTALARASHGIVGANMVLPKDGAWIDFSIFMVDKSWRTGCREQIVMAAYRKVECVLCKIEEPYHQHPFTAIVNAKIASTEIISDVVRQVASVDFEVHKLWLAVKDSEVVYIKAIEELRASSERRENEMRRSIDDFHQEIEREIRINRPALMDRKVQEFSKFLDEIS